MRVIHALKCVMKMVPRCIISHAEGGNYNNTEFRVGVIPSISTQLLKYVNKNHQNNASNNKIHSFQSILSTIAEPMEALFNEGDSLNIETQTDNDYRTQFDVRKYNTELF